MLRYVNINAIENKKIVADAAIAKHKVRNITETIIVHEGERPPQAVERSKANCTWQSKDALDNSNCYAIRHPKQLVG
jgi:hypothetical protein